MSATPTIPAPAIQPPDYIGLRLPPLPSFSDIEAHSGRLTFPVTLTDGTAARVSYIAAMRYERGPGCYGWTVDELTADSVEPGELSMLPEGCDGVACSIADHLVEELARS